MIALNQPDEQKGVQAAYWVSTNKRGRERLFQYGMIFVKRS
jgi:hypothetical protein